MNVSMNKFKKAVMYFSRREREKRIYSLLDKEREIYEPLSDRELSAQYVNTKSKYDFKKNILSVFVGTIIITVLTGVWTSFFKLANQMIQLLSSGQSEPEKMGTIGLILFSSFFCFFVLIVVIVLIAYLRSIYRLQKKMLIIEEIRKIRG